MMEILILTISALLVSTGFFFGNMAAQRQAVMAIATFKGEEESLGYFPGQTYNLQLTIMNFNGYPHLWILKPIPCPYSSLSSFLDNWEILN